LQLHQLVPRLDLPATSIVYADYFARFPGIEEPPYVPLECANLNLVSESDNGVPKSREHSPVSQLPENNENMLTPRGVWLKEYRNSLQSHIHYLDEGNVQDDQQPVLSTEALLQQRLHRDLAATATVSHFENSQGVSGHNSEIIQGRSSLHESTAITPVLDIQLASVNSPQIAEIPSELEPNPQFPNVDGTMDFYTPQDTTHLDLNVCPQTMDFDFSMLLEASEQLVSPLLFPYDNNLDWTQTSTMDDPWSEQWQ
jgi:hypothetical protein